MLRRLCRGPKLRGMGADATVQQDGTSAEPEDRPGWAPLLLRGCTKRCPRCGGGSLFEGWFRMVERCGSCGLKFEREPGFFVGAYLINFAWIIILLFIICIGFVLVKAFDVDIDMLWFLGSGVVAGLVVPIVFYPLARTIWSALDVGMTPLSDEEIRDAAVHADPDWLSAGG